MKLVQNQRGFLAGKFTDSYGNSCSIQKSSLATDDCIWLGIDKPGLTVFENKDMGFYIKTELPENWVVDSRMHLSREQVAELLPALLRFVETGELQ